MNDIEILENMVQQYKSANFPKAQLLKKIEERIYKHEIIAIENLIQRNKDLEEIEKEHKEENGRLREEIDKKDKIINLIGEMLVKDHEWFYSEFDNYTKQDFIEYFTNKVEEDIKE